MARSRMEDQMQVSVDGRGVDMSRVQNSALIREEVRRDQAQTGQIGKYRFR